MGWIVPVIVFAAALLWPTKLDAPTLDDNIESGSGGDPHFMRWRISKRTTFQGECDLVLVHSDGYDNGAGLDVHVRTTIQPNRAYSYIETAAVRLGNNVLEVHQDRALLNNEEYMLEEVGGDPIIFGNPTTSYLYGLAEKTPDQTTFLLSLDSKSYILFRFFKKMLTVGFSAHPDDFGDATGMLGDFDDGSLRTRNGTLFELGFEEFGNEWQVDPTKDTLLFNDTRPPQLPMEQCRMPTEARRNLRNKNLYGISYKQAKDTCVAAESGDLESCIEDILATGELGIAQVW